MADQAELWPLEHNWRTPWVESYEFRTEIIPSRDQGEQRRALRAQPRVRYRLLSTVLRDRAPAAFARLSARQAQSFVVPHARLRTSLSASIPVGTVAFALNTDEPWAEVGRDLVFRRSDGTSEWGRIATYSLGSGTLEDAVLTEVPAGSIVAHGIRGRFNTAPRWGLDTAWVGESRVDFLAEPGQTFRPPIGVDAETYNSRPVLTRRPDWGASPELRWQQVQDVVDQGLGARAYVDPVDYVARRVSGSFLIINSVAEDELYGFFMRRRGKQGSFYSPVPDREFVAVAVSTTDLTVAGTEAADLHAVDPSLKHIVLYRADAPKDLIELSSIAVAGSNSVLTFKTAIPPITLADLRYATWLLPMRFDSDRVEFSWETRTVAQVTLPMLSLRDTLF